MERKIVQGLEDNQDNNPKSIMRGRNGGPRFEPNVTFITGEEYRRKGIQYRRGKLLER